MTEQLKKALAGIKGTRDTLDAVARGQMPDTTVAKRAKRRAQESIAILEALIEADAPPVNPNHQKAHRVRVLTKMGMRVRHRSFSYERALASYVMLGKQGYQLELQRIDAAAQGGWLTLNSTISEERPHEQGV